MKTPCMCDGCVSRRKALNKWEQKHRKERNAKRAARQKLKRAIARVELAQSCADVSDEELDRRALEMGL